jgi:flagellar L-ring protein FlgH
MKKKSLIFAAALIAVFLAAPRAAICDEIANPEDVDSFYSDHKAYKVGDIVTVIVVEAVEGYQSASLSTSKKQSLGGGMGMSSWGGGVVSPFPYVPSWSMGGQEYQDGGGKSSRAGKLYAKLSARVERVLQNGNLVIKGTKIVKINDEDQNLIIKGVIRAQDIQSDNSITSTYVADAVIEFEGKGPVGEKTTPGILTRILDWLGIF